MPPKSIPRLLFILLAAAVVLPASMILSPEPKTLAPSMPSHYWRLDESPGNRFDDQHGGLSAHCSDCPLPIAGVVGQAQDFAAVTTDLKVPASESLDWAADQDFSIETWVRIANCDEAQAFVGRVDIDSGARWSLGCEAGTAVFEVDDGNDSEKNLLRGRRLIADNRWHHVAAVRDAFTKQLRLYVDGREDGRLDVGLHQHMQLSGSPLTIGFLEHSERRFKGALDEIAVRGRALSAAQIDRHFNDGSTGLALGYETCTDVPIRIMPVGDSNTARRTYRVSLSMSLRNEGYEKNFVGGFEDKCDGPCNYSPYHSGRAGWRPSDIVAALPDWLSQYAPQVILMHIGTNELDVDGVMEALDIIRNHDVNIVVLLAQIINRREYHPETTAFNAQLAKLANERIAQGYRVRIVDHERALAYPDDMLDELHPNKTGFAKMSRTWSEDLRRFLPACSFRPPEFISERELNAAAGVPYEKDLITSAVPPARYTLMRGPTGLRLHPETGRIYWANPVAGVYPIKVLASNSRGQTTQWLTLRVDRTQT